MGDTSRLPDADGGRPLTDSGLRLSIRPVIDEQSRRVWVRAFIRNPDQADDDVTGGIEIGRICKQACDAAGKEMFMQWKSIMETAFAVLFISSTGIEKVQLITQPHKEKSDGKEKNSG